MFRTSTLSICLLFSLHGCNSPKSKDSELNATAEQRNSVELSLPSIEELETQFGPGCKTFKFLPASFTQLQTDDGCSVARGFMRDVKVVIQPIQDKCDNGQTPASFDSFGRFGMDTMTIRLIKGCDYKISVSAGFQIKDAFYISMDNRQVIQPLLSKTRLNEANVTIPIRLSVTEFGVKSGFPAGITLETKNEPVTVAIRPNGDTYPSSNVQDDAVPIPAPKPDFSFRSICAPVSGFEDQFQFYEVKTFKGTIRGMQMVSSDSTCNDSSKVLLIVRSEASFTSVQLKDYSSINLKIQSVNYLITTDKGAEAYNNARACGLQDWKIGEVRDIVLAGSQDPDCIGNLAGIFRPFDIFEFQGTNLFVGKKDGLLTGQTSNLRPKELGSIRLKTVGSKL